MKRWQTKREKFLMGGLLLLLVVSSTPWLQTQNSEPQSENLSSMSMPESFKSNPSFKQQFTQRGSNSNLSPSKKKSNSEVAEDDPTEEPVYVPIVEGEDDIRPLYERPDEECQYCTGPRRYFTKTKKPKPVGHRLSENDSTHSRRHDDSRRVSKNRKNRDDEIQRDDENEDPILNKCGDKITQRRNRSSRNDSYTYCAMKELGTLANLTGDDKYDSGELKSLYNLHIASNLKNQLVDRENPDRQEEALNAISELTGELNEGNGKGVRNSLYTLALIPLKQEALEIAAKKQRADSLSQTNPKEALQLNSEFIFQRNLFQTKLTQAITDLSPLQDSWLGEDGNNFSDMSQFRDNYLNQATSINEALYGNNPVEQITSIQGSSITGPNSFGNRMARAGSGDMGFPRFDPNGNNSRSFPRSNNNGPSNVNPPSQIRNVRGQAPGRPTNAYPVNRSANQQFGQPNGQPYSPASVGPVYNNPGYGSPVFNSSNFSRNPNLPPYGSPGVWQGNNNNYSYQVPRPNMPYGFQQNYGQAYGPRQGSSAQARFPMGRSY